MKGPLRVPLDAIEAGEHPLPDDAAAYVARVHRLAAGAKIVVFDPAAASEADAEVVAVGRRAVLVRVGEPRPAPLRTTSSITLVQGIGKGDKIDAIARDATELGASWLVPALADRSVKRPDAARVSRWRRVALDAARQSGRGDVPRVEVAGDLVAAIERHAPGLAGLGLCLTPEGDTSLGKALEGLAPRMPVTIVVGPEGGLTAREIGAATDAGYLTVTLGPIVLRTETVCAAVLGALLARAG